MYTTVDQIEAILRLYKDPFGAETFDSTKYTTPPKESSQKESLTMSSPVVQTWQDQTWQDQTWQDQNEFELFIQAVLEEFSVSPLTMFIYSVN